MAFSDALLHLDSFPDATPKTAIDPAFVPANRPGATRTADPPAARIAPGLLPH